MFDVELFGRVVSVLSLVVFDMFRSLLLKRVASKIMIITPSPARESSTILRA